MSNVSGLGPSLMSGGGGGGGGVGIVVLSYIHFCYTYRPVGAGSKINSVNLIKATDANCFGEEEHLMQHVPLREPNTAGSSAVCLSVLQGKGYCTLLKLFVD